MYLKFEGGKMVMPDIQKKQKNYRILRRDRLLPQRVSCPQLRYNARGTPVARVAVNIPSKLGDKGGCKEKVMNFHWARRRKGLTV